MYTVFAGRERQDEAKLYKELHYNANLKYITALNHRATSTCDILHPNSLQDVES